jgi:hypothetical protein
MKPLAYLLLIVLAAGLFGVARDYRIQTGFATAAPHASEDAVRHALGRPSSVESSCKAYGTQLTGDCDHVLIYRSSFAPLRSAYWLVFIDASGHAVATSRQYRP